jgi:SpoVK/Ycf46/Vps4 family AAA+-type ATPase
LTTGKGGYVRPHRMILSLFECDDVINYSTDLKESVETIPTDLKESVETIPTNVMNNLFDTIQQLIKDAEEYSSSCKDGMIAIYNGLYYNWEKVNEVKKRDINTIYSSDNSFNMILDDLIDYEKSESRYDQFGIKYKRSYLLYGPPGTGKSSFITTLASVLNKSIGFIHFDRESNDRMLNHLVTKAQCDWIVFEDVDCMFEKRTSDPEKNGVTFSGFLNVIDGISVKNGMVFFLTTNHPENLDPALLRSGRIDYAIMLDYLKVDQAEKMFLKYCPNNKQDIKKLIEIVATEKISPAMLENVLFKNYRSYNIQKIIDDLKKIMDYSKNIAMKTIVPPANTLANDESKSRKRKASY